MVKIGTSKISCHGNSLGSNLDSYHKIGGKSIGTILLAKNTRITKLTFVTEFLLHLESCSKITKRKTFYLQAYTQNLEKKVKYQFNGIVCHGLYLQDLLCTF